MRKPTVFVRRVALGFAAGIAALVLSPAAAAASTTYYVSPSGSDTARGSAGDPFQTIGKAAGVARSGDTVLVEPGRYEETVTLGPKSSGVTFEGTGETRPVVDGAGVRQYGFKNSGASDATIENFEITGQTDAGIYNNGTTDLISGNLIHHIGAQTVVQSNGIRLIQGTSSRVTNNTIYSIGPGGESMGIWLVQTRDATVDGNTVYLIRKEGIRDWEGLDNTITDNRVFLNWVGIAFNTSTGSVATNNYIYDNVEGFDAKHTSYATVLLYWGLSTPHWSRFWHNTIYRSTETSVWIAQSDEPLDYLDVEDNIFDDAGTALVRDAPTLRGPNVVLDGNAYVYPSAAGRPAWVYKAGWSSDPGLTDWDTYRSQLGWEAHGLLMPDLTLADPGAGDLDYASDSPAAEGSLDLGDSLGRQLGARGLPPASVQWTPYPMTPIDSSSKGTWSTTQHLADASDDNQNSYWMTATDSNEYVTFDFGQPRTFNYLILTPFSQWDVRTPHGYRFDVSDDLVHWQTVLSGENPDDEGSSYKYELPAPVTSRYLRLTMVDTSCQSYAPRTNCGAYFVLSDLSTGLLSAVDSPPPASGGSGSGGGLSPPSGGSSPITTPPDGPPDPSAPAPPDTHIPPAAGQPSDGAQRSSSPQVPQLGATALLTLGGALELSIRCPGRGAIPRCRGELLIALRTPAVRRTPRAQRASGGIIARRAFDVAAGGRELVSARVARRLLPRLRQRGTKLQVKLLVAGGRRSSHIVRLRVRTPRLRPR